MVFNSLIFVVFFILFFFVWSLLKHRIRLRSLFIVIASFIFYGWWDWRFLFLLIFTGFIDYIAGIMMEKFPRYKKAFLITSLAGNLGSLSIFKYSGFIAKILDDIFASVNIHTDFFNQIPEFTLLLPVGISFYTFNSMSYAIDVYTNKLKAERSITIFFAFISMFPHLVAGPIVRARDIIPQLHRYYKPSDFEVWNASKLIIFGLFQKMVIADNLAPLVNKAFSATSISDSSLFWWMVMIAFSFQIFFDFSGYTLIARGLAKLMGYHFKMNFNHPYRSTSIKEFWGRWHISLSTWFRDYVYIPLGGGKSGIWKGIFFLWITMLLSGLWHGAAYTFIAWGAIHSLALTIERTTKFHNKLDKIRFGKFISFLSVIIIVIVAWVFFRASNLTQSFEVIKKMFSFNFTPVSLETYLPYILLIIFAILIELFYFYKQKIYTLRRINRNPYFDMGMAVLMIVSIIYLRGPEVAFIYFQF